MKNIFVYIEHIINVIHIVNRCIIIIISKGVSNFLVFNFTVILNW